MKTLVWVLLLTPLLYSQDYFKEFDKLGFSKKEIIDSLISANAKIGEDTILVFWTSIFNNSFADDTIKGNEETIPIIFLIYRNHGNDFFQTIYNNNISKINVFNSDRIFYYEHLTETGVIKEETGLKIVPPLEYSFADIVFFITPKINFYFEYGLGFEVSIDSDNLRYNYRGEWIGIIKNELKSVLENINESK
jgi:hypothetical protein